MDKLNYGGSAVEGAEESTPWCSSGAGGELTDHRAQVTCIGCEREVRAAARASGAVRRKARSTFAYHAGKYVGKGLADSREEFADKFGWDVSRTIDDIGDAMKEPCLYCAEPLAELSQCAIDIIDPGKPPYYLSNTRWICNWCNREKSGWPIYRWEDKLRDWNEWRRRDGDRSLDTLPLFGWANSGENLSLFD